MAREEHAMTTELPSYAQLPAVAGMPPRSAWGLWGPDDELGCLNLLTPERAQRGLSCARRGQVFALNWELEQPSPPFYGREALRHNIDRPLPQYPMLDDSLDNFFTQASSQWDALCHIGHPDFGYYNGRVDADFTGEPGTRNGIEHFARKGIVGRGVLLDMARFFADTGRPIDGSQRVEFTPADLEAARVAAGLTFEPGDILILRTGWMQWYLQADAEVRAGLANDSLAQLRTPGVVGGEDMAEYLWNQHFSAVAADNPAFEAWPHGIEIDQYLHFRLLPLLGLPIGEMWFLEALAADCAADGVFDFLLTSAPLNLRGGVGSPPNALAIK
jgi:kynurenine formamidase